MCLLPSTRALAASVSQRASPWPRLLFTAMQTGANLRVVKPESKDECGTSSRDKVIIIIIYRLARRFKGTEVEQIILFKRKSLRRGQL